MKVPNKAKIARMQRGSGSKISLREGRSFVSYLSLKIDTKNGDDSLFAKILGQEVNRSFCRYADLRAEV